MLLERWGSVVGATKNARLWHRRPEKDVHFQAIEKVECSCFFVQLCEHLHYTWRLCM